jgi:hypothetical protein
VIYLVVQDPGAAGTTTTQPTSSGKLHEPVAFFRSFSEGNTLLIDASGCQNGHTNFINSPLRFALFLREARDKKVAT